MAIKRNEELTHTLTWINLKNDQLSESSQTQKAMHYMVPLILMFKMGKFRDRK